MALDDRRTRLLASALLLLSVLLAACGGTAGNPGSGGNQAGGSPTSPAEDTAAAPSGGVTSPVAEETAPPTNAGTAAAESTEPSTDDATPAAEGTEPSADGGTPAAGAGAPTQLTWRGTIRMFAQAYTPNSDKTDVKQLEAFREIADEYQRQHPGIRIEFIDEKYAEYDQIIRLQASGRELPDVYWAQYRNLNGTYPKGIAVDLRPSFAQPNPYIPGGKPWIASLNTQVIEETASARNQIFNVNGDFVATAVFYNQDLLEKGGVSQPPETWAELLDASRKLRAAGVLPVSNIPNYSWWQRHWLSDFYGNDFDRIAGFDKRPGISPLDEAVAIDKKLLHPDDPRFMGWWPLMKQWTDLWKQEYIQTPLDQSDQTALADFLAGRSAMYYSGSWTINNLKTAGVKFRYSSFSFPTLGKDVSPYATGAYTANAVGGPNAGYQYAISTPQSNKTMEEPGKAEAVLDWMRFIFTPENVETVVNEPGQYLPTLPGAEPGGALGPLAEQATKPVRAIQVGNSAERLTDQLQEQFAGYLAGDITIEDATERVRQVLERASRDYERENDEDLSKY